MNDFDTLSDVFAELERRADRASAGTETEPVPARRRSRAPLIAATVVAVAGIATGTALLAGGHRSHSRAGEAGAPSSAQVSAPEVSVATTPPPAQFRIPQTADELAARLRTVLGDTASFTVTDSVDGSDSYLVGTLTADGVTGGFDIQIFRASPGTKASCDDPDKSQCTLSTLPDGSLLALGHVALSNAADGVTYQADLVRTDGVEFLMHVSNERDPKGESQVLAPRPPLTAAQMKDVLTSERW